VAKNIGIRETKAKSIAADIHDCVQNLLHEYLRQ
jgi:hypothetical protein